MPDGWATAATARPVKARTSRLFLSIDCFLPGTADPSSAAVPGKVAIRLFSA
jgi:hypothetical protein